MARRSGVLLSLCLGLGSSTPPEPAVAPTEPAAPAAPACRTHLDCFGGMCADGACQCPALWDGPNCETLVLCSPLPARNRRDDGGIGHFLVVGRSSVHHTAAVKALPSRAPSLFPAAQDRPVQVAAAACQGHQRAPAPEHVYLGWVRDPRPGRRPVVDVRVQAHRKLRPQDLDR